MSNLTFRSFAFAAFLIFLVFNLAYNLKAYVCLPSGLTSTPFFTSSSATMASPSHLQVSLAQKSKSPPTVTLRVKNTHPDTALTFVTWNTPLDGAILPLGNLAITHPSSGERLNKDSIKISRKTPPDADQFVTLAPGETREQDVELKGPLVPLDKVDGGKVQVSCSGKWGDVWAGSEDVGPSSWDAKVGKGASGEWESQAIEVEL
ncbi:hypothetical protein GTA08_BOTSDO01757 [Neofusicoccum parvum]|uniref:Uncharacterized protein n=2 Tax=Neofusicoccum TaxID=407951 RepID=R1EQE7_BOTPV|nr:hypothetical protein UCRNP2_3252 [Neofusicoccum parvum UCRNP2]GME62455.1 hypothetical protein GTA08_BOTSDO01757 [Neofusicoccum parvum]